MTVPTPTFKSFLKLRTACLIFGYTQLAILIVVSIAACVYLATRPQTRPSKIDDLRAYRNLRDTYGTDIINLIYGANKQFGSTKPNQSENDDEKIICGIAIFFLLLMDCFTVILLVGLHKNIRVLVQTFLVYSGVSLLLAVLLLTILVAVLPVAKFFAKLDGLFFPSIFDVVLAAITCGLPQVYFVLLLTSHYHDMGGRITAHGV